MQNVPDAGLVCVAEKSRMISFSKISWHHIKNKSLGVSTHKFASETRVPQLEHNFSLRFAVECRVWDHLQCKTMDELSLLTKIVGDHELCGRRQHLTSQVEAFYFPSNLNDAIYHVLANVGIDATFSCQNLRNCVTDFMLCEKVGLKIWARFKS